jgi:acyl-CoA thioester hydrolase
MGIAYYANYFIWFEVARTDVLRHAGWNYRDMEEAGFGLPVIDASCQYRQPARYDDELVIRTIGSLVSPVRVQFDYQITLGADGAQLADGTTVHAVVGPDRRPRRLPEPLQQLFSREQEMDA